MSDRVVFTWISALSAAVIGFLFWLIYWHDSSGGAGEAYASLPAWNAAFNAASAGCLMAGYVAVRRRALRVHMALMLTAVAFSAMFLVSYVIYHSAHGDTRFAGTGFIRPVYFFVLISHIVLTIGALPMILVTLYYAARSRFLDHRRIARRTLPLWLYVSATGVLVFFLLRAYPS